MYNTGKKHKYADSPRNPVEENNMEVISVKNVENITNEQREDRRLTELIRALENGRPVKGEFELVGKIPCKINFDLIGKR